MSIRNFLDLTESFIQLKKNIAQGKADVGGRGGLWSNTPMTGLEVTILPDKAFLADGDSLYGQINAHFDPKIWNTKKLGLIYTDPLFERQVKRILKNAGFKRWNDINYSEQGMQGDNYVNFDVGDKLAAELDKKGLIEVDWS